jgi:hypothetical protein
MYRIVAPWAYDPGAVRGEDAGVPALGAMGESGGVIEMTQVKPQAIQRFKRLLAKQAKERRIAFLTEQFAAVPGITDNEAEMAAKVIIERREFALEARRAVNA